MANTKNKSNKSDSDREDDEHGTKDITSQLDELEDGWGETQEKTGGDVPDGTYQTKVADVGINNAKSSGRLQASFEFTILNTDQRGRKLWSHFGIEDEEQRGYLRGALAKLGEEWPAKPSGLPEVLDGLKDTFCEVKVRTRKKKDDTGELVERQNIYIQKALDSEDVEDIEEEDDDEPTEKQEKPSKAEKAEKSAKPEKASKKSKEPEPEAAEEKAEDEAEDESKDKGDDEEAEGVTTNFKEDAITPRLKREIREVATAHKFDPGDYSNMVDLLADVAEYCGVTGKFDKPVKLIEAIKEAKPKT